MISKEEEIRLMILLFDDDEYADLARYILSHCSNDNSSGAREIVISENHANTSQNLII
jgi:hypothetical protein